VEHRSALTGDALRAGDELPTHVADVSGARLRLFDLFRGPHFTLLAFGDTRVHELPNDLVRTYRIRGVQRAERSAALIDTEGHARTPMRMKGSFWFDLTATAVATHNPDGREQLLLLGSLGALHSASD